MVTVAQLQATPPAEALERLEHLAGDTHFWQGVGKSMKAAMTPVFARFYLAGMQAGIRVARPILAKRKDASEAELDILISDPETAAALRMRLTAESNAWWSGLERTTQNELFNTLTIARRDGLTMTDIVGRIEKLFGAKRSETIAVTETTRLFGAGQQASYDALGISRWNWETAQDDRVDETCDALSAGGPYPMSQPFSPAHVGCRCWPSPAV